METRYITDDTPIAMLTVGQLKEVLNMSSVPESISTQKEQSSTIEYVYGLSGIRRLFNVSLPTAQRYKDTFLAPAIMQNGRKIIVNRAMAIELFKDK